MPPTHIKAGESGASNLHKLLLLMRAKLGVFPAETENVFCQKNAPSSRSAPHANRARQSLNIRSDERATIARGPYAPSKPTPEAATKSQKYKLFFRLVESLLFARALSLSTRCCLARNKVCSTSSASSTPKLPVATRAKAKPRKQLGFEAL